MNDLLLVLRESRVGLPGVALRMQVLPDRIQQRLWTPGRIE